MSSPLRKLEDQIRGAGGKFIRVTGKGHRRWRIGATFVDLPTHGLDAGRLRTNLVQQIQRAIRANGGTTEPVEVEREEAPELASTGQDRKSYVDVQDRESYAVSTDTGAADERAPGADGGGHLERDVAGGARADAPVDHPATERADHAYRCETCGRTFKLPQGLGRHQTALHGSVAKTAKPALGSSRTQAKPAKVVEPAPAKPTASVGEPLGDLVGRFIVAAEQALAMGQELATEHRLIREENTKLRAIVHELEAAFQTIKGRSGQTPSVAEKLLWR